MMPGVAPGCLGSLGTISGQLLPCVPQGQQHSSQTGASSEACLRCQFPCSLAALRSQTGQLTAASPGLSDYLDNAEQDSAQ